MDNMKLTPPQVALLRKARDSPHGAAPYGPSRRVLDTLNRLGLVAFVPVDHPRATAPVGHVWRPTTAGLAVLDAMDDQR